MVKTIFILFGIAMFVVSFSHSIAIPVLLNGNCSDSTISHVDIVSYAPFWREYQPIVWDEAAKKEDNTFDLSFEIEESTQMDFMILRHTWTIYVTPGDTIKFNIFRENGRVSIVFEGKNAAHYNYDPQLQKVIHHKDHPNYEKFNDSEIYRSEVEKQYEKEKAFFQQYLKTHTLSEDFAAYAQSRYTYEYVRNLYDPLVKEKVKYDDLPNDYFKGTEDISFQDSQLLKFTKFQEAIRAKYIFGHNNDPWNNFEEVYNNISSSFTGKVREFLVADMIGIYAKEEGQNYRNLLLKTIEDAKNYVGNPAYVSYIKKSELRYRILNKPFPEDVLTNTYLKNTANTTQVSLQDLLENFKGKAIYIDFWASWCSPCIYDIENSEETKKFLSNHNVVYLYLSLDKNEDIERWKLMAKKKGIMENQYIITDDFDSHLVKYLNITQIPRYVILGKEHTMKSYDAPRPTPSQFDELKMQLKEATTEVFRYN